MTLKKEGTDYGLMRGRRYAMLPVDEEVFFIDANSRTITVPTSFKRNGIAVQGDEVAEIIYFKINRYFDFMDLNNTEIYIQYEDSKGNKDVCQEWVRDIESDPDYLIFGWALRDPITKHDGTLKFSVRFVNWDDEDGTVSYNFSTLEASASVNKALNLTIDAARAETENDEVNKMIMKRLKRSIVVGADKANSPEYLLTLEDWVKQKEDADEYIYSVDLVNGKYLFKVLAYSTDAGSINYSWQRGNEILPNTPLYELVPHDIVDGEETDYVTAQQYHIYYGLSEDGKSYYVLTGINPGDRITDDCYELYGSYEATIAGNYKAVATNKVLLDEAAKSSKEILIPFPVQAGCFPNGGRGADYIMLPNTYTVNIRTTPINNDKEGTDNKYNYEYQWYKDGIEKENEISGEIKQDLQIVGTENANIENANEVQGKYYLKTTAIRNNAKVDSFSNAFLVTYFADNIKTVELHDSEGNLITQVANCGDHLIATPVFDKGYQLSEPDFQELTYQWYIFENNGKETPIEGATQAMLYLPHETETNTLMGYQIYCRVTNNYNGTKTEKASANISVNR